MNKVLIAGLIAGGLTLLDVPEAQAHTEVRVNRSGPAYHVVDDRRHGRDYYERNGYRDAYWRYERAHKMPKWLKRKKPFRRWYNGSPMKRYRFLSWDQLYEIYRYERSYFTRYRH